MQIKCDAALRELVSVQWIRDADAVYLLGSIPSAQQFYDELQVEVGKEERKWEIQKKKGPIDRKRGTDRQPSHSPIPGKKGSDVNLANRSPDRSDIFTFSRVFW